MSTTTEWNIISLPSAAAGAPLGRPAACYSCGGLDHIGTCWVGTGGIVIDTSPDDGGSPKEALGFRSQN